MSAVTLVDVGAPDRAAAEFFGVLDDDCRAALWRAARTDRPRRGRLVVTIETLTPNSWDAPALPLPMHSVSATWKEKATCAVRRLGRPPFT
jgi:hypothetical protein